VSTNNLANSFMSFSTSYSDTGLWGVYLVTENLMNVDDLVHFTLREWARMSVAPTQAEVERAKSQLKAGLLLGLDGSTAIAEDIGRQIVTSGKRLTPKEIEAAVEAVGVEDIKRVAQKYLWDKDVSTPFSYPLLFYVALNIVLTCTLSFLVRTCGCWKHRGSPGLQQDSCRHVVYGLLDGQVASVPSL
jgi:predicted Zn-dependent peptidase